MQLRSVRLGASSCYTNLKKCRFSNLKLSRTHVHFSSASYVKKKKEREREREPYIYICKKCDLFFFFIYKQYFQLLRSVWPLSVIYLSYVYIMIIYLIRDVYTTTKLLLSHTTTQGNKIYKALINETRKHHNNFYYCLLGQFRSSR